MYARLLTASIGSSNVWCDGLRFQIELHQDHAAAGGGVVVGAGAGGPMLVGTVALKWRAAASRAATSRACSSAASRCRHVPPEQSHSKHRMEFRPDIPKLRNARRITGTIGTLGTKAPARPAAKVAIVAKAASRLMIGYYKGETG